MKNRKLGLILATFASACFAAPPATLDAANFMLAANNAVNVTTTNIATDPTQKMSNPASNIDAAPVDPAIAQKTQNIFQNTADNLNLYITQLQCQSQGPNSSSCNNNQASSNNPPTTMDNVNKFLFNSVTSELGIGVQINF